MISTLLIWMFSCILLINSYCVSSNGCLPYWECSVSIYDSTSYNRLPFSWDYVIRCLFSSSPVITAFISSMNRSHLATKSVSQFISRSIQPFLFLLRPIIPSNVCLDCLCLAEASPFSFKYSIDCWLSPECSSNAFLQSDIPHPVSSLNSFI